MPILSNIGCLAACVDTGKQEDIHTIPDAAMVWEGEHIVWVGEKADLPEEFKEHERVDAERRLVIPGLVDCHTHLAFGGWRAGEFALRAIGSSYLDIAKAGGGIASSVKHTRAASEDELYEKSLPILDEMMQLGITTVECKTGYGLTLHDELKVLRVYRRLSEAQPVRIVPTLLAAHIVPPEYKSRREDYIQLIIEEIIPAVASENLAQFCDVFVEETAFEADEAERIMDVATSYGLRPKLHVDQLADGGGAALAASLDAVSADHLEYASEAGIQAMAGKGVVAVSLPFATFNLRQPAMPARAFMNAGVPVAVATDFNPGSAPSYHLPAAMYMACIMQRMSPAEVLKGATCYGAKAIGKASEVGQLINGHKADFAIIDAPDVNHWLGHFRPNAALMTVIGGETVYSSI